MSDRRYFAFYVWAYGMEPRCEIFDREDDLLAFVKKAKDPDGGYLKLRVIFGDEVDFEPATYVESYKIVGVEG